VKTNDDNSTPSSGQGDPVLVNTIDISLPAIEPAPDPLLVEGLAALPYLTQLGNAYEVSGNPLFAWDAIAHCFGGFVEVPYWCRKAFSDMNANLEKLSEKRTPSPVEILAALGFGRPRVNMVQNYEACQRRMNLARSYYLKRSAGVSREEALEAAKKQADVDEKPPANSLLDRGFGKPKEHVELNGGIGVPALRIEFVSAQQHTEREAIEGQRVIDALQFDDPSRQDK